MGLPFPQKKNEGTLDKASRSQVKKGQTPPEETVGAKYVYWLNIQAKLIFGLMLYNFSYVLAGIISLKQTIAEI